MIYKRCSVLVDVPTTTSDRTITKEMVKAADDRVLDLVKKMDDAHKAAANSKLTFGSKVMPTYGQFMVMPTYGQ